MRICIYLNICSVQLRRTINTYDYKMIDIMYTIESTFVKVQANFIEFEINYMAIKYALKICIHAMSRKKIFGRYFPLDRPYYNFKICNAEFTRC